MATEVASDNCNPIIEVGVPLACSENQSTPELSHHVLISSENDQQEDGNIDRQLNCSHHKQSFHNPASNSDLSAKTICKFCSKEPSKLRKYLRFYPGEKTFPCDLCSRSFSESEKLTRHLRSHFGKFVCPLCNKRFTDSSNLKRHARIHLGIKPFVCETCNKSFTNSCNLKTHKRSHSGSKPYKCSQCEFSFAHSSHLKDHQRLHEGLKPFACNFCDKCFTQASNLTNHIRTHSGDKPFACSKCKRCFNDSSNLRRHLRTHRPLSCKNMSKS